jgi:hypothetical protein
MKRNEVELWMGVEIGRKMGWSSNNSSQTQQRVGAAEKEI